MASNRVRTLKLQKAGNRFKVQGPDGEDLGGFIIYLESNRVLIELDKDTRDRRGGADFMMWTKDGNKL
jgi:hypothetical protein